MQFSRLLALLAITLVDGALATTLERRSTIVNCGLSNLAQPTSGTLVHPGDVIPFHFVASNWCNAGYTPISAWLLASPAQGSDINGSGQFDDSLFHFGDYLQRNILPLPQMGTPPPANLTIPDLGDEFIGQTVYLAVIQTEIQCPPDGHTEICTTSNSLIYTG